MYTHIHIYTHIVLFHIMSYHTLLHHRRTQGPVEGTLIIHIHLHICLITIISPPTPTITAPV